MSRKILSALCLCFVLLFCCSCNGESGNEASETESNSDIVLTLEKTEYSAEDESVACSVKNNSDTLSYSTKDNGIQMKKDGEWVEAPMDPTFESGSVLLPECSTSVFLPVSEDWEPGSYRVWMTFTCKEEGTDTTVYGEFEFK